MTTTTVATVTAKLTHRRHLPPPSRIKHPLRARDQLKHAQPRLEESKFLAETRAAAAVEGDEGTVLIGASVCLADCFC